MIEVNRLLKTFAGGDVRAVDDVSFTVAAGTIFTLLGPSGCGKTTTLRSVAGLERPDAGSIRLSDETVFSSEGHVFVHPYRRRIGMVFQSYAIWPHMTVMQNVVYPLKGREFGRKEVQERARKALEMVNLGELGDRPAPALSGGQQQRVALARAIAGDPRILLLDEPLSNLDAKLREEMRGQIRQLQRKLGLTSLYVTHDQVEALSLSDVIAVMDGGKLIEMGTPRDVYLHPRSRFAAQFVGLTNVIPGRWQGAEEHGLGRVETPFGPMRYAAGEGESFASEDAVLVLIRPENIRLSPGSEAVASNAWSGRVASTTFLGEFIDCEVACGDRMIRARVSPFHGVEEGTPVQLHVEPNRCSVIAD